MLSARAYSLRQKSRLAISLAWIGGFTNVVALGAMGTLVSNVSGTATWLGEAIGLRDLHGTLFFGSLLISFVAGAVISALTTETAARRGWRSKYILPIALEAAVLAFVATYLTKHPIAHGEIAHEMACLAAFAMGVQNATITKISGAVVRTTHVTGIFTDVGIEAVQYYFWLR